MAMVRWQDWHGQGMEQCSARMSAEGLVLEGFVIGARESLYGGRYRVVTDGRYCTREVQVEYLAGPILHLVADGNGHWRDAVRGHELSELIGCLDVDIGITPATNTLPILRMDLENGESRDIEVAYVPLPAQISGDFLPTRAEQRYTCLSRGRRYRYEGLFRDFTAELEVDGDFLVLDYPNTFRRI